MMQVTLNSDGQYGPTGPGLGATGRAVCLTKDYDGDWYASVIFDGFQGLYIVYLDQLVWPDTTGTMTVYSTSTPVWERAS